jgi:hypothetical protein
MPGSKGAWLLARGFKALLNTLLGLGGCGLGMGSAFCSRENDDQSACMGPVARRGTWGHWAGHVQVHIMLKAVPISCGVAARDNPAGPCSSIQLLQMSQQAHVHISSWA